MEAREVPLPHPPLRPPAHRRAAAVHPLRGPERHRGPLRAGVVLPLPGRGCRGQVQQGVLEEVAAAPSSALALRREPLGVRLAPGHLAAGPPAQRGLALHAHRVLLRALRLLGRVDVHHQLHPLAPVEPLPGEGPGASVARAARRHGLRAGRQAPLERDALPRPPPRFPQRGGHAEPARSLPRVAEGPRRLRRGVGPWSLEGQR
mmetsp:Transcript_41208/g.115105  ORF Transcript_41208/g.115105 Transcript_41208/m.115105 type:complete len:204 (-) Transcript_41208:549-1160(-)